jgi:hypothetical protein
MREESERQMIFLLPWGLFGLLPLYALVDALFGRTWFIVEPARLRVWRRVWREKETVVTREDIQRIERFGGEASWGLRLVRASAPKPLVLMDPFANAVKSAWIARRLADRAGLPVVEVAEKVG